MATYLPEPMEIREFLEGMLGRDVNLRIGSAYAPSKRNPATIGVFVDGSLVVKAIAMCDLPMSAFSGAALGLVPAPEAETAVEAGALDETLQENLAEVFNVAATLFNKPETDHLKLHAVHHAGGEPPNDIKARALTLGRRIDMNTEVSGYGEGRFSVVLC